MKAKLIREFFYTVLVFFLTGAICVSAAPLTLSSTPLVVTPTATPNFMILFDTSGSMGHVVPSDNYDPSDTSSAWATCSNKELDPATTTAIDLDIRLGWPTMQVNTGSARYIWGDDNGTQFIDGANRSKRCFRNNSLYMAKLREPISTVYAAYTGHYLNYYFGSAISNVWVNRHPNEKTRIEIGKDVISNFVTARKDDSINLGLAKFDGSNGAEIVQGISTLNSSKKTSIISSVNGFSEGGFTPLAESFHQIGRYFVGEDNPQYDGDLTIHPGSTAATGSGLEEKLVDDDVLFNVSPKYSTGVSKRSPIQYSCQKNFVIAMTDGKPSQDRNINSNLRDYDGDCLNSPDPSCTGSHDLKEPLMNDGVTVSDYSYEPSSSEPSDYMDDVALALYDIDLRPDINTPNGQPSKNNIQTYLIGFADINVQTDQLFKDTALNGGSKTPYFPTDENSLIVALTDVVKNAFNQSGSVASVAFNASQISANDAVFQAKFDTTNWSGQLIAWDLTSTGTVDTTTPLWEADLVLKDMVRDSGISSRKVITYNEDTNEGAEFVWANLSAAQQNDLYRGADADNDGNSVLTNSVADADDAQLLINYLLGDDSNEWDQTSVNLTKYRPRDTYTGDDDGDTLPDNDVMPLGDIVNSTPVFVGPPESNWPDYASDNDFGGSGTGQSYSEFKASSAASRTPMIYVGANDGMLHGFNASVTGSSKGQEMLAYIPGEIASTGNTEGLHYLSDLNYDHQFYVDLTPTIADVFIDRGDGSAWRTVLVGGLGAGGRGLYALDVTDPTEFADPANNADELVLWEFTSNDDPDLGYTFSQPTIAMMNNGKWAVITGNGYNSGEGGVGDGRAKLFIIFIEQGVDGAWATTDYVEIDTGIGNTTTPNGMSTARVVDLNRDSKADRIYAGDLYGNMWVFDVSNNNSGNWTNASNRYKLFTATDSGGNAQPITTAPIVARNPEVTTNGSNTPNLLVLFGTGKFLEQIDRTALDVMSYYGVWDNGTANRTRSNLAPREIVKEVISGNTVRSVNGSAISWGSQFGWYFDLEERSISGATGTAIGERVISDSLIRRRVLFFNTVIPDDTVCSAGGSGWLMTVDFATGLKAASAVFDANNDGNIDSSDANFVGEYFDLGGMPAKSGILGDDQFTTCSDGCITSREIDPGTSNLEGPLSWEEVYRD